MPAFTTKGILNQISTLPLLVLLTITIFSCSNTEIEYSVPESPWEEFLGNHRAVFNSNREYEAVLIDLEWRRYDRDPEKKRFIIISEQGDTVPNIHRIQVDNERCRLAVGPVKKGTYYFYYMPFTAQTQWGNYLGDYFPEEESPGKEWLDGLDPEELPQIPVTSIQARTRFNSFYPMEVIALAGEKAAYITNNQPENGYLFFAEDRSFPVRMRKNIPGRWLSFPQPASFEGTCLPQ